MAFYKAKIITVEPVVFLFMLGRFMYLPTYEQYYYHYYGSDLLRNTSFDFPEGSFCINSSLINKYTGNNNSYKYDETNSNNLVIYGQLASKIPAVVVTIILGPLTDRYGRRLGILLPSFGMFIQGLASTLIIYYDLNPFYFILVNIFSGVTGDFTSLIAACFTYAADISSPRWRSYRIAAIEGIASFGKVAGQLTGGYWLYDNNCNYIPPMIFYTGTTVLLMLYTLFLPESLTKAERLKLVSKNKGGIISKYVQGGKIYCGGLPLLSTWVLYVTSVAISLAVINMEGALLISVFFLKATPFDFSALQIGFYQASKSLTQGICSLFVFAIFVALHISDAWILLFGFIFNGVCNLLTGFATKTWELYTSKDCKFHIS